MGRKKSKRPVSAQKVKVETESEPTTSEIDSGNDETNILFEDPDHEYEWAFELVEAAHAVESEPVEIVESSISLLFKKPKKTQPKGEAKSEPKISGINSATTYYGTNSDTVAKTHDQMASVAGPDKAPDQFPKDNWMIELRDAKHAIGRLVNHARSDAQLLISAYYTADVRQLLISAYYTADVRKKSGRKSGSSRRKSKISSNGKKRIENLIKCALSHAQQMILKMYTVVMCTSGKNLMGAIEKLINDALSETRLLISKYYTFDICEKSKKPGGGERSKDRTKFESKTNENGATDIFKKSKKPSKSKSNEIKVNSATDIYKKSKKPGKSKSNEIKINRATDIFKKSKKPGKSKSNEIKINRATDIFQKSKNPGKSKSNEINSFTDICKKSKKTDSDKTKAGALAESKTSKAKSAIKHNKSSGRNVAITSDRDITKTSLTASDEAPKDRRWRRRRKKKKWNEKKLMSTAFKMAAFIFGVIIIYVAKNKVAKNKIVGPATDIVGNTSSTQAKGTMSKETMDFFRLIDTDKSGSIQREEVVVWMERNGIEGVSPDDADLKNMLSMALEYHLRRLTDEKLLWPPDMATTHVATDS